MDRKENTFKRYEANNLECIMLYNLLNIPESISFHPSFHRLIIVNSSTTNKIRFENGKQKKVTHYCSIDINDKIDNASDIFKDNPYFMDYNIFERIVNPISGKPNSFIKDYSTHLLFWIPSDKQRKKYE